jgi:NAD(P)H-dependent flavin oxidoreductase YrpB (nitropropane dioxygenase family)
MSIHTPVCELLGIEHPIVQAPLSADPRLPAAVSDAGALGSVALWWADDAGDLVRETAALTDRPFAGNFVLASDQHRRLDQALSAGLRIVSFLMGDPDSYIGPVHDAGGLVMHALGAQAAWLGTRFLLAEEMPIHEEYRRRLIAASETDAEWYPNLYEVGWPNAPHRAIHNSTAERWEAAGRPAPALAKQQQPAAEIVAELVSRL